MFLVGLGVAKLNLKGGEGYCLAEQGWETMSKWWWVGLGSGGPGADRNGGAEKIKVDPDKEGSNEGLQSLDSRWPAHASQSCS